MMISYGNYYEDVFSSVLFYFFVSSIFETSYFGYTSSLCFAYFFPAKSLEHVNIHLSSGSFAVHDV